ncbi:transposase [Candidatus Woesearchaeota archaeon]|nr:transposase [Candidatus Woesearchaeota archaeon]
MKYSNYFSHQHSEGKSTWHIEWCTKYRYKRFKRTYDKNVCLIALEEAAKKANVVLLEREVQLEHVHVIAEMPLTVAPVDAVQILKSISAKIIFALRPNLRLRVYPEEEVNINKDPYLNKKK